MATDNQNKIHARLQECLNCAKEFYHTDLKSDASGRQVKMGATFDLFDKNKNARVLPKYEENSVTFLFEFNPELVEKDENLEDYLNDTVPHEVSHAVVYCLYPPFLDSKKEEWIVTEPHGYLWKKIMWDCFGLSAERTNGLSNREGIGKKVSRFLYRCSKCKKEFKLSTTMHKRIQRGERRCCVDCKTLISPNDLFGRE